MKGSVAVNQPEKTEGKRIFTRADLLLVAALSAVCAVFLGIRFFGRESGAVVTVTQDGTEIARYPLDEEREVRIDCADGGYNVLRIHNMTAQILSADCPEGQCIRTGAVSHVGETIVCLPHRLVICIEVDP